MTDDLKGARGIGLALIAGACLWALILLVLLMVF